MRAFGALALTLTLAACGGGGSEGGEPTSSADPEMVSVPGVVKVDDMFTVDADEADCTAGRELRRGGSVTIVDPDGTKIDRAEITQARSQMIDGRMIPGTCWLSFEAQVPDVPGVYTAQVPGGEAEFEAGDMWIEVRVKG